MSVMNCQHNAFDNGYRMIYCDAINSLFEGLYMPTIREMAEFDADSSDDSYEDMDCLQYVINLFAGKAFANIEIFASRINPDESHHDEAIAFINSLANNCNSRNYEDLCIHSMRAASNDLIEKMESLYPEMRNCYAR